MSAPAKKHSAPAVVPAFAIAALTGSDVDGSTSAAIAEGRKPGCEIEPDGGAWCRRRIAKTPLSADAGGAVRRRMRFRSYLESRRTSGVIAKVSEFTDVVATRQFGQTEQNRY